VRNGASQIVRVNIVTSVVGRFFWGGGGVVGVGGGYKGKRAGCRDLKKG